MERIQREIFQSQCFDGVRKQYPDFMNIIQQKIEPVEGDISDPKIIFNPQKKQEIIENVQLIINNAASIDFNLRLDLAIQINYFGPLGLLGLAKQCKKFEVLSHVSTAYVNSEKQGFIDEKIYDYNYEPEEIIQKILKLSTDDIIQNSDNLIAPWPNTYTFTKNLAERALRKFRENVPIFILRPSIIICSLSEPYPGWIDSLAAAGTLTLMVASGVSKYLVGSNYVRSDIVPVDFVSNALLVGTAFQANKNSLTIQHQGSSHANPLTWIRYAQLLLEYAKTSPFEQQFTKPSFRFLKDKKTFNRKFYLDFELPAKIMTKTAEIIGNQEMKKNAQRFNKINKRVILMEQLFSHFIRNDWCYESKKLYEHLDQMNQEERQIFNIDPKTIDWKVLVSLNLYGIQKYMFRMDVGIPFQDQNKLLSRNNLTYFEDIQNFIQKTNKIRKHDLSKLFDQVIYSDIVQSEIRKHSQVTGNSENQITKYQGLLQDSREFLSTLSSKIQPKAIQSMFLIFHQIFKKVFDQIIINDSELNKIKQLVEKQNHSVILLPSFKSYLDLVLLQYIHIIYELDLAFLSGKKEWADIKLVSTLLKQCGGFFLEAKQIENPINKVLLEEFLAAMMKQRHIIGYQIERRRERSGKLVKPQKFIFDHILEGYMRNSEQIQDVILVPLTINYDKIYEGQQFPYELLGDESKRESLLKMIRNLIWTSEKYGRVHVQYGKPITLKEKIIEYAKEKNIDQKLVFSRSHIGLNQLQIDHIQQHKKEFQRYLSMEISYSLNDNLVIMSTGMVASILLMKRQGGYKEEDLLYKLTWLYNEILARNGAMSMNVQPSQATVRNSLKYLENFIDVKKDVFTPFVKVNMDYKNILMLAYYKNTLIHLFINESYIAVSLEAFGEQAIFQQGVTIQRLWEQTQFISNILKGEFVIRKQIEDFESFYQVLKFMESRGFLTIDEQNVKVTQNGIQAIHFFSSLMSPFIESYWVTLAYIKQIPKLENQTFDMIENNVQSLAETMYNEGFLIYYESCSKEPIDNSIQRYAYLNLLKYKQFGSQTYEYLQQNKEVVYFTSDEKSENEQIQQIYERLTFFKPIVTFNTGFLNFDDDIRRILQTRTKQSAKL